ncbi:hypothetical protein EJ03DRAFT_153147 [Teratosphaeria nubilosa]|uniref:Uncharacterized protein n=1 Tax=Teratosphaeria nubilosa TaxID=161662 RepID=A0A6G1LKI3_9PEZI|nr:hypothetical protein EJ03DRAFT_153147 [Teratosphaeria nubilosa]
MQTALPALRPIRPPAILGSRGKIHSGVNTHGRRRHQFGLALCHAMLQAPVVYAASPFPSSAGDCWPELRCQARKKLDDVNCSGCGARTPANVATVCLVGTSLSAHVREPSID